MGLTIAILADKLGVGFRESRRDSTHHPVAQLNRLLPQLGFANPPLLVLGQDRDEVLRAHPGHLFCLSADPGFLRTTTRLANVLQHIRLTDDALVIESDTNMSEADLVRIEQVPAGTIRAAGFASPERTFKGIFVKASDRTDLSCFMREGIDLFGFYSNLCEKYPVSEIVGNNVVHFEPRHAIPKHMDLVLDQQKEELWLRTHTSRQGACAGVAG